MTGNARDQSRCRDLAKRARDAGGNGFLAKPVGPRVLLARINDLIDEAGEFA